MANVTAIRDKRAILSDFLAREGRALAWSANHLDEFGKVLAKETGLPPEIARIAVEKNGQLPAPIDAALMKDQQQLLDLFAQAGAITVKRPLDQQFAPGQGKVPA